MSSKPQFLQLLACLKPKGMAETAEKPPYVSQDSNGPKNSGFVCLAKLGPLETIP